MRAHTPFHVVCIVGARPNFMKIAPLMRVFSGVDGLRATLIHTGQHYDDAMKSAFFSQLDIPEPDVDLGVGSSSHAVQTAEIMRRFEPELERLRPNAVLVVGDVNSTIACALVAAKREIPVIHVEAGLRSFDRRMPEEINRVLTDQISDLLFTTEREAENNLVREGVSSSRVRFVGNVMIDTLLYNRESCPDVREVLARFDVAGVAPAGESGYALLTMHRPSNVDAPRVLSELVDVFNEIAERLPLLFPIHPRTRARLEAAGLLERLSPRIHQLPPLAYLDMLSLMSSARMVLTDSGGIQEETTALGVPCVTLRESTERPITVTHGTNTVVGTAREAILAAVAEVLESGGKRGRIPELWDGQAAQRIAGEILSWAASRAGDADPQA